MEKTQLKKSELQKEIVKKTYQPAGSGSGGQMCETMYNGVTLEYNILNFSVTVDFYRSQLKKLITIKKN